MAITINPNITPLNKLEQIYDGKIVPLSGYDISCQLRDPHYIGKVITKQLPNTLTAYLMATGAEKTVAGDQIFWKEQGYNFANLDYVGAGLITRVGNVFTLNPSAVVIDADNIDNCKYTANDIAFGFSVKQEVLVVDTNGKEEMGIVQSIATDRKSATILSKDNAAWAGLLVNLDMIQLGKSLDNCETPSCVGFRYKDPAYSNTMKRDSECFTYCEEDLYDATRFERLEIEKGGSTYFRDRNLDELQKRMWMDLERDITLAKQTVTGSAADTAGNFSVGTNGILEQVKDRGYGWTGYIETEADLIAIDDIQRKNLAPKDYVIHASGVQYQKLQALMTVGMTAQYDPFTFNGEVMKHLGFKGLDIYGRNYFFQRWDMLDQAGTSANLATSYNFLLAPQGENKIVYADGSSENVGYITLIWKGKDGVVMKMRRYDFDLGSGKRRVEYVNTHSLMVAQARHFILGKKAF